MTMKKEGIQSRNRKASAKSKKRRHSDQDSNPDQAEVPHNKPLLHFSPPRLGTSLRSTLPSSHHLHPGSKLPIDTNTFLAAPPPASSRFYTSSRHPRYYDGLGGSFSLSPSDSFAGGSSYGSMASFQGFAQSSGQQNLSRYSRHMLGTSV